MLVSLPALNPSITYLVIDRSTLPAIGAINDCSITPLGARNVSVTENVETDQVLINAVREVVIAQKGVDDATKSLEDKRHALSQIFPGERKKINVVVDGDGFAVERFDVVSPPTVTPTGPVVH